MLFTADRNEPNRTTKGNIMAASRAARNAAKLDADNGVESTENEENSTVTEQTSESVEKTERVKRSPAERAQAKLNAALKAQAKARHRIDKIESSIDDARKALARADREVAFRSQDEDLPEQTEQIDYDVDAATENDENVAV